MADYTNPVKPIMAEWSYVEGINSTTGTRVYISCDISDPIVQELPFIGSIWSDDKIGLTVKTIAISYSGNNPSCPRKYVCSYDWTSTSEMTELGSASDLPTQIDLAADWLTYDNPADDNPDGCWEYLDGAGERISGIRLLKLDRQMSMVIQRYIYGDDLGEYNALAINTVGKINSEAFLSFQPFKVRFDGAQMEEVVGSSKDRKWLASLKFTVKLDGDWTKVYDPEKNEFRVAIFNGDVNKMLYDVCSMDELFTFGRAPLGENPVFPNS